MTVIERIAESHTSLFLRVKIDVEPNRVVHTSPVRFDDVEKMFMSRYPIARDATEIMAIAASPWIFVFLPVLSRRIAEMMVIGKTRNILFERFKTAAIHMPPNAT